MRACITIVIRVECAGWANLHIFQSNLVFEYWRYHKLNYVWNMQFCAKIRLPVSDFDATVTHSVCEELARNRDFLHDFARNTTRIAHREWDDILRK